MKNRRLCFFNALVALIICSTALWAETKPNPWGNVPLAFEANRGQVAKDVRFFVRGQGYNVFLTDDQTVIGIAGSGKTPVTPITMTPVDRNKAATFEGLDPQAGSSHYISGGDRVQSVTAPHFGKVRHNDVWQNIDMLFYVSERQLEYDFVLAPKARLSDIRLDFSGGPLSIDSDGNLILRINNGEIRHQRPFAYQEKNGVRRTVEVRFRKLGKNRVGFDVGKYDHSLPLVIDPKLDYSTYWGGASAAPDGELGYGIAVDALGNTYVAGITPNLDFPLEAPLRSTNAGSTDAFLVKIAPGGTAVLASTYIGGSGGDEAHDVKVDAEGNIYLTGYTGSTNFPILNGFQRELRGVRDAYLLKLNPTADTLLYSTYLGGGAEDRGYGLAVSSAGDAYITGATQSGNFPILNAAQPSYNGGLNDAFITRVLANGTLAYSTFIGGAGVDLSYDVEVGPDGSAYAVGYTTSLNFPRRNENGGFTPFTGGPDDAFVVRLGPSGDLILAVLLGGIGSDEAVGVALDANANIYVTGYTASFNFPIWNPLQPLLGGGSDVFITRIRADGSFVDFSTFWGSSENEGGTGIAVDASGFVHVTGFTGSFAFPLINAFQDRLNQGTPELVFDPFLLKLTGEGNAVVYSTYLGGRGNDGALDLAVDTTGNVYLTGYTSSTQFPLANALQPQLNGLQDAFILKFNATDVVGAIDTQVPGLGLSRISLGGIQRNALFGWAEVAITEGSPHPAGLEIINIKQLDKTVSEVGLPLTAPVRNARLFVETLSGTLQESIAVVNPGSEDVKVDFFFTFTQPDENGQDESASSNSGTFTLPPRTQLFVLLANLPFGIPPGIQGTLTLNASGPITVTAVKAAINGATNLILSRIPVHDLDAPTSNTPSIVPHFVEGGGWHTHVVLVNQTDNDLQGSFQFFGPGNSSATAPLEMDMSHASGASFPYRIPARSAIRVVTTGFDEEFTIGFIKIVPDAGHVTPTAFTFLEHGDETAATLEAQTPRDRFRLYAESTPASGTELARRFALGMANSSDAPVTLLLELTNNDGASTGISTQLTMQPGTQISRFMDEIPGLESAPETFRGVVKVTVLSGTGVTVTGVQSMTNEDGVFLMTTTGPIREDATQSGTTVFPYIPTGAQYTTSLILFGTAEGAGTSGEVRTFDSSGTPLFLVLK